jgi:hypothetical protein
MRGKSRLVSIEGKADTIDGVADGIDGIVDGIDDKADTIDGIVDDIKTAVGGAGNGEGSVHEKLGHLTITNGDDVKSRLVGMKDQLTIIDGSADSILASTGEAGANEGTIHEKLGAYAGGSGDDKNVKDDMAAVQGSVNNLAGGFGEYTATHDGFYDADNTFHANGSGFEHDENGMPLDDVQVEAFVDADDDDIFETLVAKTYTNVDGKWTMLLDAAMYLLRFYRADVVQRLEWRAISADGSVENRTDDPEEHIG